MKQRKKFIQILQKISVEVLGYRIKESNGIDGVRGKFIFTSIDGVPFTDINSGNMLLSDAAAVIVRESYETFEDVPHDDKNYIEYMPIIELLNLIMRGNPHLLDNFNI